MARRASKRRARLRQRREATRARTRVRKWVRELFSSGPTAITDLGPPDDLEGGLGVREPRRPVRPALDGSVVLDPPPTEAHDVWAVGEDR